MNPKGKNTSMPNLYLIGFMGTGKSSVGKIAAKKIGLTFIDTDQEIENQSGLSISKIFEKLSLLSKKNKIIKKNILVGIL